MEIVKTIPCFKQIAKAQFQYRGALIKISFIACITSRKIDESS